MKYKTLKDLVFYGSLLVFCVAAYFVVPGNIPFRLFLGTMAGLIVYAIFFFSMQQRSKDFAAAAAEDIQQQATVAAGHYQIKDGSFFTTPKPLWSGFPHLQRGLFYAFWLCFLGIILRVARQAQNPPPDYLQWVAFGAAAIFLISELIKGIRAPKSIHQQVVFYKDHLVFLPKHESIPYSKIDFIDFFTRSYRGYFSTYALMIRHKGINHNFQWNTWFHHRMLDTSLFKYFGFKDTISLVQNLAQSGYRQQYVYDPSLAPTNDLDAETVRRVKMDQNLMILAFLTIGLVALVAEYWQNGLLQQYILDLYNYFIQLNAAPMH